jgi:hypothetical protein
MEKFLSLHEMNEIVAPKQNPRQHLVSPRTPYRTLVDEQAVLHVFWSKAEYEVFLEQRDTELTRY